MAVAPGRVDDDTVALGATDRTTDTSRDGAMPTRVGYMQERLERQLAKAGLAAPARAQVLDASGRAMTHRAGVLRDDTHFETLHPGRTVLILLDDCGITDADVLTAAALVETEHSTLRIGAEATLRASGRKPSRTGPHVPSARALASGVPVPASAGDALLEELIVAAEAVRRIALAERLDHARHLHLRELSVWSDFHRLIDDVYLPVARRSDDRLARRLAWWYRTFQRRFLGADDRA